MFEDSFINFSLIILLIMLIVIFIFIILASIKIVKRQKKKYNECIKLINENKNVKVDVEYGMSDDEIKVIDSSINVNNLMKELIDIYMRFENKVKILDIDLKNELCESFYEYYINIIENYKLNNSKEVKEKIELVNYSIIEISKTKLKFRITINCINYIKRKNLIVSGSNLHPIEQIIIVSYEKLDDKWLISGIEKVYEKKIETNN